MAKTDKYGIRELYEDFPNDDVCLDFLFDASHSRSCSCGGTYTRIPKRKQYQCSTCRFQIAPMAGTIFEKSTTPLTLWFHAILAFSSAKSGISAKELERQLNVTYKTAWRILKQIRSRLEQNTTPMRYAEVEMDEAFFGGKGDGGPLNKNQKHVMKNKIKVIGAYERHGEMRAKVVPDLTARSIGKFLRETIDYKTTHLITDSSNRYGLVAKRYERTAVHHRSKQWSLGTSHINHVENFWGHLKRSITGTHKSISKKYFQNYLDGFVWHYNQRNDRERFENLISLLGRSHA